MTAAWIIVLITAIVATAVFVAVRRRRARPAPEPFPAGAHRPVVLVHGVCGFESVSVLGLRQHYFRGVADHLERAGVPVYTARLSALGSVPERAQQLTEMVRALPGGRVTLVAHSMGGIDARYAIARLGLRDRVAELITIGTPHRGSPVADLLASRPAAAARRMACKLGLRSDAIDWLTTERMRRFNDEVEDVEGVRYMCVIGKPTLGRMWRNPLLFVGHLYVRRCGGANDGLVPVESQRWGHALAELPVHHFGQVGWTLRHSGGAFYESLLRRLRGLPPGLEERPAFSAVRSLPPASPDGPRGLD